MPPPDLYQSLDSYTLHLHATLSGPAPGDHCVEAYLPGALSVPDVQNFDFSGEGAFGDESVWLWTRSPLAYATERTPQQMPVALLNGDQGYDTAGVRIASDGGQRARLVRRRVGAVKGRRTHAAQADASNLAAAQLARRTHDLQFIKHFLRGNSMNSS